MAMIENASGHCASVTDADVPRPPLRHRRFDRVIALSQYGFPFALGRYSSPVGRFRALARRARFKRHRVPARTIRILAATVSWPFGALATTRSTHARMRGQAAPYGVREFADMYWLALRHSIPPLEYAVYRLDQPARRKDMHEYVYWNDLPGVLALNTPGVDYRDVQDKHRFAQICAEHGLPHVETLAVFDRGKQIYPSMEFVPDAPALWTKALRLKGGAGGAKWIRTGQVYRDAAGQTIPAKQVAQEFRKEDRLVQPFVENHSEIAKISDAALASLRIITGMDRQSGAAEFVMAAMLLPHGGRGSPVGWITCGIDFATGRIRDSALFHNERTDIHPDTGAALAGFNLPFWRESIDLVLQAHACAFSQFAFLGWDVALTETGPILLETNSGWGALGHQMLDGPLGHTAFSRLVAQYV